MALLVDFFAISTKNQMASGILQEEKFHPKKQLALNTQTKHKKMITKNIFTVISVFNSSVRNSFSVVVLATFSESVAGFKIFTVNILVVGVIVVISGIMEHWYSSFSISIAFLI